MSTQTNISSSAKVNKVENRKRIKIEKTTVQKNHIQDFSYPPYKKQKISHDYSSNNVPININLFESLQMHYEKETNMLQSAELFHKDSDLRLEAVDDFMELKGFDQENENSFHQLSAVKNHFKICRHQIFDEMKENDKNKKKIEDHRNDTNQNIDKCIEDINALNKSIESTQNVIERLIKKKKMAENEKLNKNEQLQQYRDNMMYNDKKLDELHKMDGINIEKSDLIKKVFPMINVLEAEYNATKLIIENKKCTMERNCKSWNSQIVISWFKRLKGFSFNINNNGSNSFYAQMDAFNVTGKQLMKLDKTLLNYMGITTENDQNIVLKEIKRLKILEGDIERETMVAPKCVICTDGIAEYSCFPCAHLCICYHCSKHFDINNNNNNKCPNCGKQCSIHKMKFITDK